MKKLRSIKTKTFTIVGLIMLLILAAFIIMFSNSMIKMLAQNEFDTLKQNGRIAGGILNASVENASAITRDWSSWDETYSYLLGENPSFPEDTLTDYPFLLHKFNFIIITDTNGNIVYSKFYDFIDEKEAAEPDDLLNFMAPIFKNVLPEFIAQDDYSFQKEIGKDGFFFADSVCYYVSILPVLNSDETSDVVGTYTFGRIIDEDELARITNNENMHFVLEDINSPQMQALNLQFEDGTAFVTNPDTIFAYTKMTDFFGQESIVIGVENSRALYNDGVRYVFTTSLVVAFGILLLLIVLYALLNCFVLRPVRRISQDLQEKNDDLTAVSGKHYESSKEFYLLQCSINAMLQKQRESKQELKKANDKLTAMAYYDELTGLYNINKFKIEAEETLKQHPNVRFAVVKIDVQDFKVINEMFGFEVGDAVVRAIAHFIQKTREQSKLTIGALARVNADEFILLDLAGEDIKEGDERTDMFENAFNDFISELLGNHRVEFRYGRYYLDMGATDINSAIEKANLAHRVARAQRGRKICNYDDGFKQRALRETDMQNKMEAALKNKEFKVFLQPKYCLNKEELVGAEALVRWQEPDGRLIPPGEFIPLFERNGFVTKLDTYMFESVCGLLKDWLEQGFAVVPVSVNFSRLHLTNDRLAEQLLEIAGSYGIPEKYLEIELTESVILDNEKLLEKLLTKLNQAGFAISMDDFGSGYSSLGLLKNLHVDVVKIDKSFFSHDINETRARAVVESVIHMAKKLGMHTVAEGVETKEHVEFLREVGCDIVQGYYFARPMPPEEFEKRLRQ